MFIVDIRFHYYLRTWLNCTLDVVGTILVVVSASPLFILAVVVLGYLYFVVQVSLLNVKKNRLYSVCYIRLFSRIIWLDDTSTHKRGNVSIPPPPLPKSHTSLFWRFLALRRRFLKNLVRPQQEGKGRKVLLPGQGSVGAT